MFFNYCFLKEMPFSLINNSEKKNIFTLFPIFYIKVFFLHLVKLFTLNFFLINNNNFNKKFNLYVNNEPTVFSAQYISTQYLESQENNSCNGVKFVVKFNLFTY